MSMNIDAALIMFFMCRIFMPESFFMPLLAGTKKTRLYLLFSTDNKKRWEPEPAEYLRRNRD